MVRATTAHGIERKMARRLFVLAAAVLALVSVAHTRADAHPHVWVTMKSELIYAPDGTVTGVRHAWTFDEMFSTFATQGIETKTKGQFTREELKPLAEVNVTSLKEFDYFTYLKVDGAEKKGAFKDPTDYWLDFKDSVLTLNFDLPLKAPLQAKQLEIEIYDDSYFVDFTFSEKDPVKLAGAPAQCKVAAAGAGNDAASAIQRQMLSQIPPSQTLSGVGAQFSNKISVTCS
jgi:ABC-type uncharacterized transport system substrate-binding protein